MNKNDTKLRITNEAIEVFSKHGFHKTTFQMIATKLEITQPALYVHFKNKNDLLLSCVMTVAGRGRDIIDKYIDERASADVRLGQYIEGNLYWITHFHHEAGSLIAMYYYGDSDEKIKAVHAQIDKIGMNRIETILIHGLREKAWKVNDPKMGSRQIHNLLVGEMIKAFHWPKELSFKDRLLQTQDAALKLLRS